jgi:hypothetical protein
MIGSVQQIALIAIWALACISASTPTFAQSCITCEGPPAMYKCTIPPDPDGRYNALVGRTLDFACIQDVARLHQHDICRADRSQPGECGGRLHQLGAVPVLPPEAGPQAAQAPGDAGEKPTQKANEPKTVVEMARRTVVHSQEQMKRSTQTVTDVARSTWRCIATLFSDCGKP